MPRKVRTYTIVSVSPAGQESGGGVDFLQGISADELPARLANKPAGAEYHVFAGEEIKWALRQVVDVGVPRKRSKANGDNGKKKAAASTNAAKPNTSKPPKISIKAEQDNGEMAPIEGEREPGGEG